jgi:hypothetical protein
MRRSVSLSLLALLLSLMASTARAQRAAIPVWEATDGGPDSSSCSGLVRLPGGDVVSIGSFASAGGEEVIAARLDEEGRFLWVTHVPAPYDGGGVLIARVRINGATGDIVVMGQAWGGPTVYDFFFVSFDPDDGHVVADRTIDHFDWDLAVDMEIGQSGNIVMCGYGLDPGRYLVSKLDASFQTLWEVDLGNSGQSYQHPTDLDIAPNGDVLVAGIVSDGVQRDVRVDRLTQSGLSLYSKDFGDPDHDDGSGILCVTSSGTYFAFEKAAYEPNAEARLYRLDDSGTVTWGTVDSDLAWVTIRKLGSDQLLAVAVGPFSLGPAQTFRKLDLLGNDLGTRTLVLDGYERSMIDCLDIGPDDIIYAGSSATPDGGDGTDWFVSALTTDGALVYQWSYDSGAGTYDLPDGLVALAHGRAIVCGRIGDSLDEDAHIVMLQAQLTAVPDTVTMRAGRVLAGDLASLASVDNDPYLVCRSRNATQSTLTPIELEIEATIPGGYPRNSIDLSFTSRAFEQGLEQTLELWNWRLQEWDRATPTTRRSRPCSSPARWPITSRLRADASRRAA